MGGDAWFECSTYVSMYGHVYMYIYIYIYIGVSSQLHPRFPLPYHLQGTYIHHTMYSHMCVYMDIMHGVCGVHGVHRLIYIYIYTYERERETERNLYTYTCVCY